MPALKGCIRFQFALLAATSVATSAQAHDVVPPAGAQPLAGVLLAVVLAYATGVASLWRQRGAGRGLKAWQAASFAGGTALAILATLSPLHVMGRGSFTAHMVEHEILMVMAAPLAVLGAPRIALLAALPRPWRPPAARALAAPPLRATRRFLSGGPAATMLHGVAIWLGHIPAVFAAALASEALHDVQHVAFTTSALVFWHAVLNPHRRGAAAIWLLVTALHTGFLGILLTLAPRVLVPLQGAGAASLGLTPLEDQQIAGLVMWVPGGFVYAGAALVLTGVWIARSSR